MSIKVLSPINPGGYVLPTQDGLLGQILTTDGSGAVSFQNPAPTNNFYLTGLSFNTASGVLTATVSGSSDVTVNLDGRYALSTHTHSYDNYQSWNLRTNGVQRTTIQSGGILDLTAGSSISLAYGAGGVVTIASTDTLDSITGRGDTTTNSINAGAATFTGNVGIGTTSPSSKLHIKTSVDNSVSQGLVIERSVNSDRGYINYNGGGFQFRSTVGDPIVFGETDAEHMRILPDGNVGIGTATPNRKLTVQNGSYTYPGGIDANSFFAIANDGWSGMNILSSNGTGGFIDFGDLAAGHRGRILYGQGTDYMEFDTAGSEKMRITSAGNVGIGTTSPIGKLQIGGTSGNLLTVGTLTNNWAGEVAIGVTNGNGVIISKINSSNDTNRVLVFYRDDTNGATIWGYTPSGGSTDVGFQFRASGVSYLNGGNVGIGTTSPAYKLDISGQIRVDNGVGNGSGQALIVGGSGDVTLTSGGSLFFGAYDYGNSTYIRGYDNSAGLYFYADGTLTMNVAGNGNVGIGTTSPSRRLTVMTSPQAAMTAGTASGHFFLTNTGGSSGLYGLYGGVTSDGDGWFQSARNDSATYYNLLLQANGGNVGIGTTAPTFKLDVSGTARINTTSTSLIKINSTGSGTVGRSLIQIIRNDGTEKGWDFGTNVFKDNSDNFTFREVGGTGDGLTRILIQKVTGKVGIATTAPSEQLHVTGNVRVTGAYYDSSNSAGSSGQVLSSTGSGTDWVSLSEISGVDGTGTANYVAKWSDADTIANSQIFDNGTNVGIGTTSPTFKLEVLGNSRISSNLSVNTTYNGFPLNVSGTAYIIGGQIYVNDNYGLVSASASATGFYPHSTEGLLFKIAGSEKMRITSGGNVGIGTTAPVASLDNQGSSGTYRQRDFTTMVTNTLAAAGTQAKRFEIARASIDYNDWNSVGPIEVELYEKYFSRGLKKKYVIYYGYVSSSGCNLVEMTGAGENGFMVSIGAEVVISGDNRYIPIYVDVRYYSQVTAVVKTNRGLTTANPPGIGGIWMNNMPTGVDISDFTADSTVYVGNIIGGNSTFSSGNVGIGTTSPSQKLHVVGKALITDDVQLTGSNPRIDFNSNGASSLRFYDTTNASERVRIDTSGNVGIGTTSPSEKLAVHSTATAISTFYTTNSSGGFTSYQNSTGGVKGFVGYGPTLFTGLDINNFGLRSQSGMPFATGGGNVRMYITSAGNVGIGTTSPSELLEVVGNIRANVSNGGGFMLTGASASGLVRAGATGLALRTDTTDRLTIDNSGNVGIGTASPLSQLSIGSNAITTKKPTVIIADEVAGGSLVIRGLSPILSFDRTGASPENKILMDGVGLEFKTGTLDAEGDVDFKIKLDGKLQAPAYTQGFLQSDANGNIEISGGGTLPGGPYLPLAGGTMTGQIYMGSAGTYSQELKFTNNTLTGGIDFQNNGTLRFIDRSTNTVGAYINLISGEFATYSAGNAITNLLSTSGNSYFNGGNVGIGTTSPSRKLHVNGDVQVDTNLVVNSGIYNTTYYAGSSTATYFKNSVASDTLTILESGNVGIGTTSPGSRLDIIKEDGGQQILRVRNYATSSTGNFTGNYAAEIRSAWTTGATGGALLVHTQEANDTRPVMAVSDSNGVFTTFVNSKVGIGTASPAYKLEVEGSIGVKRIGVAATSTIDMEGNFNFDAKSGYSHVFKQAGSELARILPSGNVGIGTTNPSVPLAVEGVTSMGSNSRLSMGILDINSGGTPTQILIQTTIPWNSGSADFTVNIKGFVYGTDESCNLSIHWHYYTSVPYNANCTSSGSWAPIINLHSSSSGFVQIHLSSPGYWPKLYVESMYSSAYNDLYASGWSWSDAAGTGTAYPLDYNKDFGNNFVMTDPGNVGIGTSSPGAKLQVSGGDILISNGQYYTAKSTSGGNYKLAAITTGNVVAIGAIDYTSAGTIFAGGDNVSITTGGITGSSRLYINSAGNVGIGTTAPIARLTLPLEEETNYKIAFKSAGTTHAGISTVDQSGAGLYIGANSFVNASGVATYSDSAYPSSGIYFDGWYADSMIFYTAASGAPSERMRITSSGQYWFKGSSTSTGYEGAMTNTETTFDIYGSRYGGTGKAITLWATGASESMRINYTGNVLIGTTADNGYKLIVSGGSSLASFRSEGSGQNLKKLSISTGGDRVVLDASTTADATTAFAFQTGGSERMRIDSTGNVGIGTTSPSYLLTLEKVNPILQFKTTNTTGTNTILFSDGSSNFVGNIKYDHNDNSLSFATTSSASERMRITSTGNVGIGTSSPGAKLDIAYTTNPTTATPHIILTTGGTIKQAAITAESSAVGGLVFSTGDGTLVDRMTILRSNGNVGIGTTSPGAKLQVSNTVDGYVSIIENLGTGGDKSGLWVKTDSSWTSAIILKLTSGTSDTSIMEVNPATVRIGGGTLTANDARLHVVGDINIINANISNQELAIPAGTTTVATVSSISYSSVVIDYVVKKGLNLRSGTIVACHDGTNVVFTETSTPDLGITSDITFAMNVSGADFKLEATTISTGWLVKTLVRAL